MNITTTYDEAMVKAMIAEAVAKEREACAKVCENANPHKDYGVLIGAQLSGYIFGCDDCAAAIRARGENT